VVFLLAGDDTCTGAVANSHLAGGVLSNASVRVWLSPAGVYKMCAAVGSAHLDLHFALVPGLLLKVGPSRPRPPALPDAWPSNVAPRISPSVRAPFERQAHVALATFRIAGPLELFNTTRFRLNLANVLTVALEDISLNVSAGSVIVEASIHFDQSSRTRIEEALSQDPGWLQNELAVQFEAPPRFHVLALPSQPSMPSSPPVYAQPPAVSLASVSNDNSSLALMTFVLVISTTLLGAVAALLYVMHRRRKRSPRASVEFGASPKKAHRNPATNKVDMDDAVAVREASEAACRDLLRSHLKDYVRANGPNSNFKAWIATLHPENVTLDSRMWMDESEQLQLWRELTGREPDRPRVQQGPATLVQSPSLQVSQSPHSPGGATEPAGRVPVAVDWEGLAIGSSRDEPSSSQGLTHGAGVVPSMHNAMPSILIAPAGSSERQASPSSTARGPRSNVDGEQTSTDPLGAVDAADDVDEHATRRDWGDESGGMADESLDALVTPIQSAAPQSGRLNASQQSSGDTMQYL